MVTAAPSSRIARALVAVALTGSAASLGFGATAAWAEDPTPAAEVVTTDPVAADPPAEAPAQAPTIGSWIIGGTELEATAGKPVVAKPVAQPAVQPPAAPVTRSHRSSSTRTTSSRTTTARTSTVRSTATQTAGAATAPDGALALPFTGGHVEALLPTGFALLVGGVALTLASRPRRTAAVA